MTNRGKASRLNLGVFFIVFFDCGAIYLRSGFQERDISIDIG